MPTLSVANVMEVKLGEVELIKLLRSMFRAYLPSADFVAFGKLQVIHTEGHPYVFIWKEFAADPSGDMRKRIGPEPLGPLEQPGRIEEYIKATDK